MARDDFEIVVSGEDRASGVFRGIGSSMQGMGAIANTVSVAIGTALGQGITTAVNKVKEFVGVAGSWANTLDDMQDVLGTTGQQSAAIATAIGNVGGNVDAVSTQFVFLARGLENTKGQLGPVGQELKDLGINVYDAKGNLRDVPSILALVSDKFAAMPDGIEKSALMTRIFGRSGKDLSDVMNELANGGLARADAQAKALGLSLGDKQVAQFKVFDRMMANLQQTIQGFGVSIGVAVLPLLQAFVGRLLELARSQFVIDFMDRFRIAMGLITDGNIASGLVWLARAFGLIDDKGVQAAGDLVARWQGDVMGLFQSVIGLLSGDLDTGFDNLGSSIIAIGEDFGVNLVPIVNTVMPAFANIVRTAAQAFQYLGFLAMDVIGIFTGNGPMGDASSMTEAFAADLASLANLFGLDGSAVESLYQMLAVNLGPTLQSLVDLIGANIVPILTALGGAIGLTLVASFVAWAASAAAAAIATLAALAPLLLVGAAIAVLAIAWNQNWGNIQGITATALTTIQGIIQSALNAIQTWWAAHGDNVMTIVSFMITSIQTIITTALTMLTTFWADHGTQVQNIISGLWSFLQIIFSTGATVITGIVDMLAALINGNWDAFGQAWLTMTSQLWTNMQAAFRLGTQAIMGILQALIPAVVSLATQFYNAAISIGTSIIEGVKQGIWTRVNSLISAITKAVQDAIQAAKDAVGFGSPAKAFIPIGASIPQGLAVGVDRASGVFSDALTGLLSVPGASNAGGASAGNIYNTFNISNAESMAMALAYVETQRKSRLNSSMGV